MQNLLRNEARHRRAARGKKCLNEPKPNPKYPPELVKELKFINQMNIDSYERRFYPMEPIYSWLQLSYDEPWSFCFTPNCQTRHPHGGIIKCKTYTVKAVISTKSP
ncbi:hypothetical protein Hanom_Chr07g00611081 [Helianthus anomalus]